MCKMIVTHMYLPSMWDKEKAKSVYPVLEDFDSFEEWYRSELRGRMVQTLMEVDIQSLHVMLQDTDMHDDLKKQCGIRWCCSARWTVTCVLDSNTSTLGTKKTSVRGTKTT